MCATVRSRPLHERNSAFGIARPSNSKSSDTLNADALPTATPLKCENRSSIRHVRPTHPGAALACLLCRSGLRHVCSHLHSSLPMQSTTLHTAPSIGFGSLRSRPRGGHVGVRTTETKSISPSHGLQAGAFCIDSASWWNLHGKIRASL